LKKINALNTDLDNLNAVIKSLKKNCFNEDAYISFIIHCSDLKMNKNEILQILNINMHLKKIHN
jgi:hypothetical protein